MQKNSLRLLNRISKLENGTFLEDDIKLFLIEIREKLKNETFLREICDFIAHPDRSKGICHKKVDVRYAKLKLIEDNIKNIITTKVIENNKTMSEFFFTDTALNYIQTSKIEKELFELIIISGIDDIDNKLFLKNYKQNNKEIKKFILNSYDLINKYYVVNTTITKKDFLILDDMLKFIRGTISGEPAFTEKQIFDDFINGLKGFCKEINYEIDYNKIKMYSSDIIVCIIALLHDSTFKLFDGTIGRGFISLHPKNKDAEICLMSIAGKYILPLITTKISARDYIDDDLETIKKFEYKISPWFNCIRDHNKKLKLAK